MKQPYRTGETPLKTLQIRRLIEDLRRIVAILDAGIAEEEAQARILDPTKPEYPFLGQSACCSQGKSGEHHGLS
jgi:hypothetical protein